MGWGECTSSPTTREGKFREAGPPQGDTRQVGGFDLQTRPPSPCHVTTSLDTPISPVLGQRSYIPGPWQHPHCHPHCLGGGRPRTTPRGNCLTGVVPRGRTGTRGCISTPSSGPGLPNRNCIDSAVLRTTVGKKRPPIPSHLLAPAPRDDELPEAGGGLGVSPQPLPALGAPSLWVPTERATMAQEPDRDTSCSLLGVTNGLLFTSLFQTLT